MNVTFKCGEYHSKYMYNGHIAISTHLQSFTNDKFLYVQSNKQLINSHIVNF